MTNIPTSPLTRKTQDAPSHGLFRAMRFLKLIFISGPQVLLTSQISVKCAAVMMVMCAPALIFTAMLTLPALVFQSPQQNGYFYFAKVLDEDPTRWVVLFVSGVCAILSLALPATMEKPDNMEEI